MCYMATTSILFTLGDGEQEESTEVGFESENAKNDTLSDSEGSAG